MKINISTKVDSQSLSAVVTVILVIKTCIERYYDKKHMNEQNNNNYNKSIITCIIKRQLH